MARILNYEVNENILCYHGPLIYEAKILKAEYWNTDHSNSSAQGGPHYFVHYKGWNDKWDEWVPEIRVLKLNDENLQRQKNLTMTANTVKKKTESTPSKSQPDNKRSKKKDAFALDESRKEESSNAKRGPEMKLPIPETLKVILVDEWQNITKSQKLVSLPAQVNVATILNDYRDWASVQNALKSHSDIIAEICDGLREYFDLALGTILLYSFERVQYKDLRRDHGSTPMSSLYGVEHLLRLFVKLPTLITHTPLNDPCIAILREHLVHFLKYLEENQQALFHPDHYEFADPSYLGYSKGV